MKRFYNAILSGADGGYITVAFPDFPGCVSGGENVSDALAAGREALNFHLEAMAEDNEPIPTESNNTALSELLTEAESRGDFCRAAVIEAELPNRRAARINLSLPRYVLDRIDQYAERHNRTRSALLAESALEYIRTH